LQQILFYRDLGFELKQIQEILEQSDVNRINTLKSQKKLLADKIANLKTLMKTIDKTINFVEGKKPMKEKEIFEGFEVYGSESETQKKYEKQLEDFLSSKYGPEVAKQKMKSNKQYASLSKEESAAISAEFDAICKDLVKAMQQKLNPDSKEVQSIVRRHFEWLKHFWTPDKVSYVGHADLILETDLRKAYEKYHPKLAEFIAMAIKIFASQELK
jgi:DNA-binding transcriptional MerR regulator